MALGSLSAFFAQQARNRQDSYGIKLARVARTILPEFHTCFKMIDLFPESKRKNRYRQTRRNHVCCK